ncbi:MAG: hypothetical protein BGN92_04370 [Sphingobacteriales bacterium 41-5]|nr:MAG: hypothetical protein BGN92_04370 [Sphingobacteriales bacterium 41-5]
MKKIILFLIAGVVFTSCSREIDDYDAPSETLTGTVIDKTSGKAMNSEYGTTGNNIILEELSWSDNPTPYNFGGKIDGTFNNSKLFKGTYRINVEGPFVPLLQRDSKGDITVDGRKTVDIAGVTKVDFEVEPFFKVEWVGDLKVENDGRVSADVKYTRGTTNPAYQVNPNEMVVLAGYTPLVLQMSNYDNRYEWGWSQNSSHVGAVQKVTTRANNPIPKGAKFYYRIGVRNAFNSKYNYSDIREMTIPN